MKYTPGAMSLEPEGGPWSIYPLEDGDELLDAHNDILLKFPVGIEPKTKRAIVAVPELLDEMYVLLDYMPYVPAYQRYKGPNETWDEAIRAHEDVERALALLRRIYGEEEDDV